MTVRASIYYKAYEAGEGVVLWSVRNGGNTKSSETIRGDINCICGGTTIWQCKCGRIKLGGCIVDVLWCKHNT